MLNDLHFDIVAGFAYSLQSGSIIVELLGDRTMCSASDSFLILGLGELGTSVLRGLASRAPSSKLAVLIRPQTLASPSLKKHAELEQLRAMDIEFVTGDLAVDTALSK